MKSENTEETLKLQQESDTALAKLAAYTAAYVRACTEVLPTADPEAESVLDRALAVKSSGVRRPLRRKVSAP